MATKIVFESTATAVEMERVRHFLQSQRYELGKGGSVKVRDWSRWNKISARVPLSSAELPDELKKESRKMTGVARVE